MPVPGPVQSLDADLDVLELTVLMPCLDEAETVAVCIDKAHHFLARSGIAGEVLVADNGSVDGSPELARRHGARVIEVAEKGYGHALRHGIEAARGRYVIIGDADDSYDFSGLERFVDALRGGDQLVMGNRFKGGIRPGAMPTMHRYLGNPVLSFIGRLFFGPGIGDFHCGLRGFDRRAVLALELRTGGMEFASEMVVKAKLHGLRISEVATTLSPDGRSRPSHLRTWRDGWRHLRFLLLMSPRWLFLYPGLALLLIGLAGMLWITGGARQVLGLFLDVNTLMYSFAALLCGVQLIGFSLFSKVVAMKYGLHPRRDAILARLRRWPVEVGILSGAALTVIGLGLSVYAVVYWGRFGFGGLLPTESLRIVIPAIACIVIGMQVVFSSFFLALIVNEER